jgi:class 3 adenylate cyclase/ActR/RegA family two-component response regulator
MEDERIRVFLADDNLIVREGVQALLRAEPDIEVVGVAADRAGLIAGADETEPQVLVTDIRMPPDFRREGIEAAAEVRKRHPGTGVVILSQYDQPEYAISLLREGASGCAYLLKDCVADGDQLARAVREVATGGSMLDPQIVQALVTPVTEHGDLAPSEEELLQMVAEGRPIKAIAAALETTPARVADDVETLFRKLADGASAGVESSLERLRMLHSAIVEREEHGETLSRFLPHGLVEKLRRDGRRIGESERLLVTVLMSDIRGYSSIAEHADPTVLARQLSTHRAEMSEAILAAGGTVMHFFGDAIVAVFGAPLPQEDHARHSLEAALQMHVAQDALSERWAGTGLPPFDLGIGLSTGEVAAVLLGSEERMEYTVIGDNVNLAQRLQQWAGPGETVMSEATHRALEAPAAAEPIEPARVKGREAPVRAYRIKATQGGRT